MMPRRVLDELVVSVLFSEPKIPQFSVTRSTTGTQVERFSALQRAENSSIPAASV